MSYTTNNIQDLITQAANQYGVPASLALAVAQAESGFNPNAKSSAGAIGVMQLMPDTAGDLGVDPYNVEQNIDGGVRYLSWLMDQFDGDATQALAAYNYGIGRVQAGASWPNETRTYVARVLDYQRDYGPATWSSPDFILSATGGQPAEDSWTGWLSNWWGGSGAAAGQPETQAGVGGGTGQALTVALLLLLGAAVVIIDRK